MMDKEEIEIVQKLQQLVKHLNKKGFTKYSHYGLKVDNFIIKLEAEQIHKKCPKCGTTIK